MSIASPNLDEKNPSSSGNLAKTAYFTQRTKTLLMPELGKVDTPIIKLTQIEQHKSPEASEEELKETVEILTEDELTLSNATEEKKPMESVAEIFKQRLIVYRK